MHLNVENKMIMMAQLFFFSFSRVQLLTCMLKVVQFAKQRGFILQ